MPITAAQMMQELRNKTKLRKRRAGGSGEEFPLRVAKVTRVDAKKMTCSLFCLTGNEDSYDDVAITFPGAGGRSFLGVMPEVQDLCVVGFSPAESGGTRVPYIVGWLVASAAAGYDWVVSSTLPESELNLTPALKEALSGSYGRRRVKLRQMDAGNLVGSSSQGSDLVLNESVLLANRRGNEIILRDQDQALVTRSLQTFHAGAGVRVYSGMVQRDATLLPTQTFSDGTVWDGDKQVDEEGNPIPSAELDFDPDLIQAYNSNPVFGEDANVAQGFGLAEPSAFMDRGLYLDDAGNMYDGMVIPSAVYGGKPIYRVSIDGENGVLTPGTRVFSEYRIEVSHTSDGTLPVTEQTDGVDIDRLLPTSPTGTADGGGDLNLLNRSPNEAMASLVLGTAVGNDPYWDRNAYGVPLVPQMYDKNGVFSPTVRGAEPGEDPKEHAAFLVRVRNPYDLKAPEAFMGITKGGTLRSYFPGTGSSSHQEFFKTGKSSVLGLDSTGLSYGIQAEGTISLKNVNRGRPSDNIGVEISSKGGAVSIYGGAALTSGADSLYPSTPPANALRMESAKGALLSAVETLKLTGQTVSLTDADTVEVIANNLVSLSASDTLNISSKSYGLTVNGKVSENFGGPKDALPTNGAVRSTSFSASPLTGFLAGAVDEYEILTGNRVEVIKVGNHFAEVYGGQYSISVANPAAFLPEIPNTKASMSWGPPVAGQEVSVGPLGSSVTATIGFAKLTATLGSATVSGKAGVSITSLVGANISAPLVVVTVGAVVQSGGVLTDGCIDPLTGRSFLLSGGLGVPNFRVG